MKHEKPPMPDFDYANWQCPLDKVRVPPKNIPRTSSLFDETISKETRKIHNPIYTLKPKASHYYITGEWLPSAKQIYLHSVDEYDAAMKLVGDMLIWSKLCKNDWFMYGVSSGVFMSQNFKSFQGLIQWRYELESKRKSEALKLLQIQANKGNVSAIVAILKWQEPKKGRTKDKENMDNAIKKKKKQAKEQLGDRDRLSKVVNINGETK